MEAGGTKGSIEKKLESIVKDWGLKIQLIQWISDDQEMHNMEMEITEGCFESVSTFGGPTSL